MNEAKAALLDYAERPQRKGGMQISSVVSVKSLGSPLKEFLYLISELKSVNLST
jgi:hypothetical protein